LLGISREKAECTIGQLRRKVRSLNQRNKLQQQKINHLSELVAELKHKNLLEQEPADILTKCFDGTILQVLKNELNNEGKAKGRRRYSQEVKQFALALFYYSPQAYEYCRTIFTLPNVSSIRNWLGNIEVNPGFLTNVIDVAAVSGEKEFCLIIDSMSLHKQIAYEIGHYTGFCDYGGVVAEDTDAVASEALVFLLVPLRGLTVQYPVGYFLVEKISAQVQAELVRTVLC
jgi:hypothetical protein